MCSQEKSHVEKSHVAKSQRRKVGRPADKAGTRGWALSKIRKKLRGRGRRRMKARRLPEAMTRQVHSCKLSLSIFSSNAIALLTLCIHNFYALFWKSQSMITRTSARWRWKKSRVFGRGGPGSFCVASLASAVELQWRIQLIQLWLTTMRLHSLQSLRTRLLLPPHEEVTSCWPNHNIE